MSNLDDDQLANDGGNFESDAGRSWQIVSQACYEYANSDDLTTTIIDAIAEVEGVDQVELKSPVLYDCIDVTALEHTLFGPRQVRKEGEEKAGSVQFRFGEYRVVVRSDGWVLVYARG